MNRCYRLWRWIKEIINIPKVDRLERELRREKNKSAHFAMKAKWFLDRLNKVKRGDPYFVDEWGMKNGN